MKVVISGYGKMGRMVEQVLAMRGIECAGKTDDIMTFDESIAAKSVCIDFTTPTAIRANYRLLADRFKATVIGTTGWNDIRDDVRNYFEEQGKTMIYSSNFSVGVNLLFAAVDYLTKKMAVNGGYSPYIIEKHHIHKLDAPSGTARTLADIAEGNLDMPVDIQSVRCGEIPGIHTIGFEGDVDRITVSHEAFSRMGFAQGAVEAAIKAEAIHGVHDFKNIIFE